MPLTTGFIAKFGVIQAAVDEHSYVLAVIAMVSAVIAAFLYLRIIVSVWLSDTSDGASASADVADTRERLRIPFSSAVVITLCVGFTLLVGVFPDWLIDASDKVVNVARPLTG